MNIRKSTESWRELNTNIKGTSQGLSQKNEVVRQGYPFTPAQSRLRSPKKIWEGDCAYPEFFSERMRAECFGKLTTNSTIYVRVFLDRIWLFELILWQNFARGCYSLKKTRAFWCLREIILKFFVLPSSTGVNHSRKRMREIVSLFSHDDDAQAMCKRDEMSPVIFNGTWWNRKRHCGHTLLFECLQSRHSI